MSLETLGSKEETTGSTYVWKLGYLIYMIVLLFFAGYMYVGAANMGLMQQAVGISFFVIFLALPFFISHMVDFITRGREGYREHDTVTVENPMFSFLTPSRTLIISAVLAGIILFRILGFGAWVMAPEITIFQSAVANNIASGVLGIFEQWGFFYWLFPTGYAIATLRFGVNPVVALVIAGLIISLLFMTYHNWRYAYQEGTLQSVFVFAWINILGVFLTRAAFFGDILHFFNNYLVSSGLVTTSQVLFRLV